MTSEPEPDPEPGPGAGTSSRDVLGCVGAASAALGGCSGTTMWVLTDADLMAAAVSAQRLPAAAELVSRLMVEVDQRGLATEAGAVSAAAWLRQQTKLTAQAAGDRVRLGRRLAAHDATRAALAGGEIMVEQASVITRALEALPATVDDEQVGRAERWLLGQAAVFDARTLTKLGSASSR